MTTPNADERRKLFEAGEKRVYPGREEKVPTSWKGLMLAAFAEAARGLDRDDGSSALAASYRQVAERNADFLLHELRRENGRLLRTWKACTEGAERGAQRVLLGFIKAFGLVTSQPPVRISRNSEAAAPAMPTTA